MHISDCAEIKDTKTSIANAVITAKADGFVQGQLVGALKMISVLRPSKCNAVTALSKGLGIRTFAAEKAVPSYSLLFTLKPEDPDWKKPSP